MAQTPQPAAPVTPLRAPFVDLNPTARPAGNWGEHRVPRPKPEGKPGG
jgi:hypothetical protein